MKKLRMHKSYGSNVAGEVCLFPEDVAAKLVAAGLADYVEAPAAKAPAAPPADKAVHAAPEKKGLFGKKVDEK